MDLFAPSNILTPIPLADGELALLPRLALPLPASDVMARLVAETEWRAETVVVFGLARRRGLHLFRPDAGARAILSTAARDPHSGRVGHRPPL
jgi:hypothetical protein